MTPKLPPTDTGVCGTAPGAKRHWRKGESACPPCLEADRERRRGPRTEPAKPTAASVAAEIEFFLRCGEGTHAIIKALGYQQNPHSLKQRLRDNGRKDLWQALIGEAA